MNLLTVLFIGMLFTGSVFAERFDSMNTNIEELKKRHLSEDSEFDNAFLLDVNGDSVPELFIGHSCGMDSCLYDCFKNNGGSYSLIGKFSLRSSWFELRENPNSDFKDIVSFHSIKEHDSLNSKIVFKLKTVINRYKNGSYKKLKSETFSAEPFPTPSLPAINELDWGDK